MNLSQIAAHNEQMEALRRDFGKLWLEKLLPTCRSLNPEISKRDLSIVELSAWTAFVYEKRNKSKTWLTVESV
jgi:hypothetical protein